MRVITALARTRLRHRPSRWLLVALGVALATALPVVAQGAASVVSSQAIAYGIAQLDPGQRSLIVSDFGVAMPPDQLASIDAVVRARLAPLTATAPREEMLSHRISDQVGGTFFYGAADNLADAIHITSGRAPQSCTPSRCEVVVIGNGTPRLDPSLGLVIVGRAVRTDPLLLTGAFDPGHDSPILLGDGVARVEQLASLSDFQRTYGWVSPIDLDRVRRLGVDAYLARSAAAADQLGRAVLGLALTAPDDVLHAEQARAALSTRRFALLAGSAVALLLGFAALAAIGLRRDHAAISGLLRRRGAGRRGVAVLTAIESVVPVLAGAMVGLVAGAAIAGLRAGSSGLPPIATAVDAARGAAPIVAAGAATALLLIALIRSWPTAAREATAWHALEFTVAAGLAVAGLALARGAVTASGLDQRTDPLLLMLPVLVVVCGGLLVGRCWPALTRGLAAVVPHRWLGARIGLLGGVRRPLRPVATAAFLAAATGTVVFAAAYRSTLAQGAADQAAFQVPLSATVRTGSTLVTPLSVASLADFSAMVPGTGVHPVVRAVAGVRRSAAESSTAQLVGVDPAALPLIPSYDHVVGGPSATRAEQLINPVTAPRLRGIRLPAPATRLAFPASGDTDLIVVTAWLRSTDGVDIGVPLEAGHGQLSASLPASAAGATLFAFSLAETSDFNTIQQHHFGEGGNSVQVLGGSVTFGAPALSGADWAGWGSTGARVHRSGRSLTIDYQFTGSRIVVRAGMDVPESPLPVLADPATAAAAGGGLLSLVVQDSAPVQARVVGVVSRFPTTGPRCVIADAGALANALDVRDPGTGSVGELWLQAPAGRQQALARALSVAPFDQLDVQSQDSTRQTLANDPVARGASSLLVAEAWLGLLVAAVAVMLLVVAERRDEAVELYAWESDGVAPASLRRSLVARAGAVVAVATPGGLLVGLVLSLLTARLVAVTAVGTAPTPPLALAVGPGWIAAVLGVGIALGLAAAVAVAEAALRERLPRRPEEVAP